MWSFLASKPLLCLLVAAFVLRVGMAFAVQGLLDHRWHRSFVISGDADGYWQLGQAIAAGEDFAIHQPPRYVLRMPGFPLLLSLPIRLSDGNFLIARLFLAIVGSAACGLVYLLGRELFNPQVGLWAGGFTAVSPAMVGFSVMILSETPFALGMLGTLWSLAVLIREFSAGRTFRSIIFWSFATGGFIAFATYMRPSWLPMAGLCPLGLLAWKRFHRDAVVSSAVILGTVALALLPWGMRNHRLTGHWIFTTLWSGPSLYDGLNPQATGESNMEFFDHDNLMAKMSEYEVNQHYWRAGREYAWNHPRRAVELGWIKLGRFWKPWPSAAESGNWASQAVIAVFSLGLFAGSLVGVWLYRQRFLVLALTVGPVLFFSVLHGIFVGSLRYRLPAEYPLAVLAAAGGLELYRRCFAQRPSQGTHP